MSRQEAVTQFQYALKEGQRYYREHIAKGEYPYLHVLDELFEENKSAGHVKLGVIDIPIDLIVGSVASGRKTAFAGNYMPLLGEDTEFGHKWISLCEAHLSESGVSSPILCYEYLGHFFVQEGNKRVSVLKSFGAPTISGSVIRVMPKYSDDPAVQIYYEFLEYYQYSHLYYPFFSRHGCYSRFLSLIGYEKEHYWTKSERSEFTYAYMRFKEVYDRLNTEKLNITVGDALLLWMELYPLSDISTNPQWEQTVEAMWNDFRLLSTDQPIALSTEPLTDEESMTLSRKLGIGVISHLNIAFVHAFPSKKSAWTFAHEIGRKELENTFDGKISVKTYYTMGENPYETMQKAVEEGADVLIATTPPMIGACRQIAAEYPTLKVLNCSLSMPYSGVRTYYGRIYEAKFVAGAIAGAMATDNQIGYIANYPIIGVPASINAFALGAQFTNPRAKIKLKWSCLPGNPIEAFRDEGVRVISNQDAIADGKHHHSSEWGTFLLEEDGSVTSLASPIWNWGKFYVQLIRSIFNGNWETLRSKETDKALNYWWGMSSGLIAVHLCGALPDGTQQMAELLRSGLRHEIIDPFHRKITDQSGIVRNDGVHYFMADEIMHMNWLCDSVIGTIPEYEDLLPESQELVRLLGLQKIIQSVEEDIGR